MRWSWTVALVVGFTPQLASAAGASHDIGADFLLLQQSHDTPAVLEKKGQTWTLARQLQGHPVESSAAPIVDVRNGYLAFTYQVEDDGIESDREVEAAVFTAAGGRVFVALVESWAAGEGSTHRAQFFEITAGAPTEVPGAFALQFDDFVDEALVRSLEGRKALHQQIDEASPSCKVTVAYRLPRKGTTVEAKVEIEDEPVGTSETGQACEKLHQVPIRHPSLHLEWSARDGRFTTQRGP